MGASYQLGHFSSAGGVLKTEMKMSVETAKGKYSSKVNIFNIVRDVGKQQDPELQTVSKDITDSQSKMTTLIREAQDLKGRYCVGGPFVPKDKFGTVKEEMSKIKIDFEAALFSYEAGMKNMEELYKERYGVPHLFVEGLINENVSTFSKEFGRSSFIKEETA